MKAVQDSGHRFLQAVEGAKDAPFSNLQSVLSDYYTAMLITAMIIILKIMR